MSLTNSYHGKVFSDWGQPMEAEAKGKKGRFRTGLEVLALVAFIFVGLVVIFPGQFSALFETPVSGLVPAKYYTKLDGNRVQCNLCFRQCIIGEGQRGFCGNRKNIGGTLYTLIYGKPSALQIDPVEKEPLFHVYPGSAIFCIGTAGCNFRCSFCQNWHIAHKTLEEVSYAEYSPEELVEMAIETNCTGFHFTYNEPTVFYEYMYDISRVAQAKGLHTAFHSNGAMSPEPLRELLRYMDAVTVDLKGFNDEYFEYITEPPELEAFEPETPPLEVILETLKIIKEEGVWLEIVNLVIPTLNDDPEDIRAMCSWIRENLGEEVPLHFLRFGPACKLTKLPPTPLETLELAREIALEEGLRYVYIGNVLGHEASNTYCPECGEPIISRFHFFVYKYDIEEGRCPHCGCDIPGLWER